MYKTGYLFKETHDEVHYVREGYGCPGDDYGVNFTPLADEAAIFKSWREAMGCIMLLMEYFERDDDYRWTPVVIDLGSGSVTKVIDSRWH